MYLRIYLSGIIFTLLYNFCTAILRAAGDTRSLLFFMCISGAAQHLAGIGGAKTVITINTDPKAPIFAVADYRIVGDCISVLEKLLLALD